MTGDLRILFLANEVYGAGGGIAQYNRDLLNALSTSNDVREVVVLERNTARTRPNLPAKVSWMTPRAAKLSFAVNALKVAREKSPFDVVFCGHLHLAALSAFVAGIARANLWLQIHGVEAWQAPGYLLRRSVDKASMVTAVSRHTRRLFIAWANCAPEIVKVLPNTVEERFCPGPRSDHLIERYGLTGKKVLLTVSRVEAAERYKGHDRVMEAVARLSEAHPDLVYVVAGDGDDLPRLKNMAGSLGIEDRVRFVGYVPDEELPDLYRAADVFVMPSTGEGFGIVFLQALASGIPVIGGDADGSRDPLRDGLDGVLVDEDPSAISLVIVQMMARTSPDIGGADAFERKHFSMHVRRLVKFATTGRRFKSTIRI